MYNKRKGLQNRQRPQTHHAINEEIKAQWSDMSWNRRRPPQIPDQWRRSVPLESRTYHSLLADWWQNVILVKPFFASFPSHIKICDLSFQGFGGWHVGQSVQMHPYYASLRAKGGYVSSLTFYAWSMLINQPFQPRPGDLLLTFTNFF